MATDKLTDTKALRKAVRDDPEIDGLTRARIMLHIANARSVDAVEVVHGRWDEWWPPRHMILTGEEMLYRCSACTAKYADVEGFQYCPFCGAKMELLPDWDEDNTKEEAL